MFNEAQRQMLIDALNMAIASNKRMQNSKPQFKAVFDKIDADLTELSLLIKNMKIKQ